VLLVFQEEGSEHFEPSCVKSNFIQIIIVVKVLKNAYTESNTYYRVSVCKHDDVPNFGPAVPFPPIFKHGPEFKEWLMKKLVNAELAAYRGKLLKQHMRSTFKTHLTNLYEKYTKRERNNKPQGQIIVIIYSKKIDSSILICKIV